MKPLTLVIGWGVLLLACTTESEPAPDFTVLVKARYTGDGPQAKTGTYVTIMLGGVEREAPVTTECFNDAVVGAILAQSCR